MPVPWNEKELQLFLGAPPRGGHVRVLRTATCFNCTIRHVAHVQMYVARCASCLQRGGRGCNNVGEPANFEVFRLLHARRAPNLQRGLVQFSTKFRQSLVTLKPENVSFAVCQLNRVKFKCFMLRFH